MKELIDRCKVHLINKINTDKIKKADTENYREALSRILEKDCPTDDIKLSYLYLLLHFEYRDVFSTVLEASDKVNEGKDKQ